jgi:hypothetical protein
MIAMLTIVSVSAGIGAPGRPPVSRAAASGVPKILKEYNKRIASARAMPAIERSLGFAVMVLVAHASGLRSVGKPEARPTGITGAKVFPTVSETLAGIPRTPIDLDNLPRETPRRGVLRQLDGVNICAEPYGRVQISVCDRQATQAGDGSVGVSGWGLPHMIRHCRIDPIDIAALQG